jgi:hypothetical protein
LLAGAGLLVALCGAVAAHAAPADEPPVPSGRPDERRIQGIVDDYRAQLTLPQAVRVVVVPQNTLMVSVESVGGRGQEFQMSIQESFLLQLSDQELKAVVAHELGHVWIFTHHPYLQTEALANQVARRLVTRESLIQVYEKVWKNVGTKGELARFVSD